MNSALYLPPLLFSLTTVGIIYHGNCDYPLHPGCTSFAGDSGSGKSTIADLLQLIFVGPRDYRSATQAQEDRPVHGLVLGEGKQGGVAYALVNIAMPQGGFVAMGCYVAATTRECYPFIVSQGYQDSQLRPFQTPLSYEHFLVGNEILPHHEWKAHLEVNHRLTAKVYTRHQTDYHRTLFQNQLLPLDLTNPATLKTYASILRTFSRSGELEKSRDVDYHQFLFGQDARREMLTGFHKLEQELAEAAHDQAQQQYTRDRVQEMLTDFQMLRHYHAVAAATEHAYAVARLRYTRWQADSAAAVAESQQQAIRQLTTLVLWGEAAREHRRLGQARLRTQAYQDRETHRAARTTCEQMIHTLTTERAPLRTQFDDLQPLLAGARRVAGWLTHYGNLPVLRDAQQQQQSEREQRLRLQTLETVIAKLDLTGLFHSSGWSQGMTPDAAAVHLQQLRDQLAAAQQTSRFTDLDHADSLAGWALARHEPLSREAESVLAHFRTFTELAQCIETSADYHLTSPKRLLDNLCYHPATRQTDDGFWLDLHSVCRWIAYVPVPAFADADEARIRALFAQRQGAAADDITALETRLEQEEQLAELVRQNGAWEALAQYTELYQTVDARPEVDLPNKGEFEQLLGFYNQRQQLQEQQANLSKRLRLLDEKLDTYRTRVAAADAQLSLLEVHLADAPNFALLEKLQAEAEERTQKAEVRAANALAHLETTFPADFAAVRQMQVLAASNDAEDAARQLAEWESAQSAAEQAAATASAEYQRADQAAKQLTAGYAQHWPDHPLVFSPAPVEEELLAPTETARQDAEKDYRECFAKLVGRYAGPGTQAHVQPDELDLFILKVVPPDIRPLIERGADVVEELTRYLDGIIEKNNDLATVRLSKLRELLESLDAVVAQQIDEVKRIQHYLRTGDHEITGKFRPTLTWKAAEARDWLRYFGRVLNSRADEERAELLAEDNLPKLMRQVYQRFEKRADHCTAEQTTPQKLLDPKTYLDIQFGMTSTVRDEKNSGSTGQTFMAAALLNVARLSIIGQGSGRGATVRPGIRFMALDEAAGLGSNYHTLVREARKRGYQVITLSIDPVVKMQDTDQTVYFLGLNPDADARLNLPPMMVRYGRAVSLDEQAVSGYWGPLSSATSE